MARASHTSPPAPIGLGSHAESTLQYIRTTMEAASTVSLPGSAGLAMGTLGILAACVSWLPEIHEHWLLVWLITAPIAAMAGGVIMTRQAIAHGRLFGAPIRRFATCLAPALASGAVLTAVDWREHAFTSLPGTWLLLYGAALLAASATTTRLLGVLGGSFALLALIAFLVPASVQNVCLGLGFGLLHCIAGLILRRRTDHALD